eukprot:CAMPEP_0184500764 /NCGR_PEP_ID=MMETSP0113_2-20130426/45768_1 /TAXON_ID=91329 /ORGANISM="Norrisiella sphaerica, Strain BC52" /LENGTH=701 /DNA_ID=CAMNT_0026889279 /DNA_START=184 /DNA_END=2289 /DNA_ORIENTATION=+
MISNSMQDSKTPKFDLIVTDIEMPLKNGLSLARESRKLGFMGTIIATSGCLLAYRGYLFNNGVDFAFQKPVRPSTVQMIISRTIPLSYSAHIWDAGNDWYIIAEKKRVGPHTLASLKGLLEAGLIPKTTQIWNAELGKEGSVTIASVLEKKKNEAKNNGTSLRGVNFREDYWPSSPVSISFLPIEVFDKLPIPVTIVTAQNRFAYVNFAYEELVGYKSCELVGELTKIVASNIAAATDLYPKIVGGVRSGMEMGKDIKMNILKQKGGKSVFVRWEAASFGPFSIFFLSTLTANDSEEAERLNDMVEGMESNADQLIALEALRAQIDVYSHDVRTPLHGLMNMWPTIRRACTDKDLPEVNFIEDCIGQLLGLARTQLGITKNFSTSSGSILNCMKQISNIISRLYSADFCFNVSGNGDIWILKHQTIQIFQVVSNLVNNARTANPDTVISVDIKLHKPSMTMRIQVRDEGKGLPEELAEYLTGQREERPTVGLGTCIVRTIAESLGGHVEYHYDKGSVITVILLLYSTKEGDSDESDLDGKDVVSVQNRSSRHEENLISVRDKYLAEVAAATRILAVEDVPLNQRILKKMLEKVFPNLTQISFAKDAIDFVSAEGSKPFDLILMDIGMPSGHMDGIQASRYLRKRGYKGGIIGLTGYTSSAMKKKAYDAGMNKVINKPFNRNELLTTCYDVLTQTRASSTDS